MDDRSTSTTLHDSTLQDSARRSGSSIQTIHHYVLAVAAEVAGAADWQAAEVAADWQAAEVAGAADWQAAEVAAEPLALPLLEL